MRVIAAKNTPVLIVADAGDIAFAQVEGGALISVNGEPVIVASLAKPEDMRAIQADIPERSDIIDIRIDGDTVTVDGTRLAELSALFVTDCTNAVQRHLDATAQSRGYDGILSACTYATSGVAKFAAEGQACLAWRDAVWSACYAILDDVQAGRRSAPTIDGLLKELPAMIWST